MNCPNCGTDNPYGSTYCSGCGAPISAQPPYSPYNAGPTPPYGQPYAPPSPYCGAPTYEQPAKGMSIASLVLGIISIFLIPIITGPLAIIFAGVAKSKGNTQKITTAGLVTGIVGVAGWLLLQMYNIL